VVWNYGKNRRDPASEKELEQSLATSSLSDFGRNQPSRDFRGRSLWTRLINMLLQELACMIKGVRGVMLIFSCLSSVATKFLIRELAAVRSSDM
jgi:hypothetical protein